MGYIRRFLFGFCLIFHLQNCFGKQVPKYFNDPALIDQWHLGINDNNGVFPGRHNNIWSAWQQGATGEGVKIALIDNGVDVNHVDLKANIDVKSSFNFAKNNRDLEPNAKIKPGHGTRMAGIIAMSANNSRCGVGIAYKAKLSVLTFGWTVLSHVKAYSNNIEETDIYSSSIGPPDTGAFANRHADSVLEAYKKGVEKGRNGLGSIYIRASGNGGYLGDHCGADGGVNNVYSIAVASATRDHRKPVFGEPCASILTSVYTQQTKWYVKGYTVDMVTTHLNSSCTIATGGSSPATAVVSSIVALALSVNPKLTWRDVQYLIIASSRRNKIPGKWTKNGFGLRFNPYYGFGVLDAGKMVKFAKKWKTVPELVSNRIEVYKQYRMFRTGRQETTVNLKKNITKSQTFIRCVEQVSLITSVQFSNRGRIALYLISPMKTVSEVLGYRTRDKTRKWYSKWRFTSVHFWGEDPYGEWTIRVKFSGAGYGRLKDTSIELFGTKRSCLSRK